MLTPKDYIGPLMELGQERRGVFKEMNYITEGRASIIYELPLAEVMFLGNFWMLVMIIIIYKIHVPLLIYFCLFALLQSPERWLNLSTITFLGYLTIILKVYLLVPHVMYPPRLVTNTFAGVRNDEGAHVIGITYYGELNQHVHFDLLCIVWIVFCLNLQQLLCSFQSWSIKCH